MKSLLILFLAFTLLILPCSAENVTIEILQNSAGEYFIDYEGDLIPCTNDTCIFDIANFSANNTDVKLSKDDMKKIAQYVALEIEIPEYSGMVNETRMIELLGNTREQFTDWTGARLTNTVVPSIEELDEVKQKLAAAEAYSSELNGTVSAFNDRLSAKNEKIENLEDAKENTEYLASGLAILFVASLLFQGNKAQEALDWWRNRRK